MHGRKRQQDELRSLRCITCSLRCPSRPHCETRTSKTCRCTLRPSVEDPNLLLLGRLVATGSCITMGNQHSSKLDFPPDLHRTSDWNRSSDRGVKPTPHIPFVPHYIVQSAPRALASRFTIAVSAASAPERNFGASSVRTAVQLASLSTPLVVSDILWPPMDIEREDAPLPP